MANFKLDYKGINLDAVSGPNFGRIAGQTESFLQYFADDSSQASVLHEYSAPLACGIATAITRGKDEFDSWDRAVNRFMRNVRSCNTSTAPYTQDQMGFYITQ